MIKIRPTIITTASSGFNIAVIRYRWENIPLAEPRCLLNNDKSVARPGIAVLPGRGSFLLIF